MITTSTEPTPQPDSAAYQPTCVHVEGWARAAHEVIRAFCFATGETEPPPWRDPAADPIQGMNGLSEVSRVFDGITPEQQYEAWRSRMETMQTNMASKGYPAPQALWQDSVNHAALLPVPLVPYAKLPESRRRKDALVVAVVKAMMEALKDMPSNPGVGL